MVSTELFIELLQELMVAFQHGVLVRFVVHTGLSSILKGFEFYLSKLLGPHNANCEIYSMRPDSRCIHKEVEDERVRKALLGGLEI